MFTKSNQILSPKLLTSISIALLLFFLCYWNINNYQRQKAILKSDIISQLELAHSDIKDSMMMIFISKLDDVRLDKDTLLGLSNTIHKIRKTHLNHDTSNLLNHDIKDSMTVSLKIKHNFNSAQLDQNVMNDSNSFISSSHETTHFKQIIIESDQDTELYGTDIGFGFKQIDKSQLDKIFNQLLVRLEKNELPRNLKINSTNDSVNYAWEIHYDDINYQNNGLTLNVMDHSHYLLKKIIPEILFSLFLISLVCFAFWTLLKSWKKQEKLNHLKNEFIGNMTHELKTPIATINLALEEISEMDEYKNSTTTEYINISQKQVSRLSKIVDKVLQISTFDQKEKLIDKTKINIFQVVKEVVESMQLYAQKKDISLSISNNVDEIILLADQSHMTNLVYNLLDNAIKYSPRKTRININLIDYDNFITLEIIDHGYGIAEEYQHLIFDRFFRVPNNDIHDIKGYGLGLSYVDEIIKAHQGEISVESELEKGTRISIKLPKL